MANSQLLQHAATSRFSLLKFAHNPGLLYNCGNLISVLAACADCVFATKIAGQANVPNFTNYFFGTWPAMFTSMAVAVFLAGGNKYALAWKNEFPPDQKSNAHGHLLSALGALLIGIALLGLAQNQLAFFLAFVTTILHVGGKFGSLVAPTYDVQFKIMPLLSRATYVATLTLDVVAQVQHSQNTDQLIAKLILPACLIAATLFWARADWLLMPKWMKSLTRVK
jgi:hypothetical protein